MDTVGHYRIKEKLGSGGMGDVYLAEDLKLKRDVALKLLPAAMADDPQRKHRFLQEAHAASVLNHPNVSTIFEIGESGDTVYIAMEHIQGQTLAQLRERRPLEVDTVIDIAAQVADALDEAELRGVVHRDIKSANIMVTPRGHVKVLDFGLAKLSLEGDPEDEDTRIKTTPGMVMGTSYYMSPEQALGRPVDHRSDLFSLGIVLYELTTGTLPFAGATTTETIDRITHAQPESIARLNYSVPPELERIVRKLLEKDPARRYQSARELMVDLRNLKRDTSSGEVAPAAKPRARRPLVWIVAAAVMAAAIIGGIFLLPQKKEAVAGSAPLLDSVAVIPFVNGTSDPEMEYLTDGIAETLINDLAVIPAVRVIPRSTAFRYKGTDDLQKIARELNVRGIVSGRVTQRGNVLTIQAELIDAESNAQVWGARYEREATEFAAVQREISRELIGRVRSDRAGQPVPRPAMTTNNEAWQLYLKGRYHWNKRTAESIERALGYFEQAAAADPEFALAHVGVADSHLLMEQYADVPTPEVLRSAETAVRRALAIDDQLAEAHTTLAFIHYGRWEWEESEREYRRAIELNPNYPTARHWYNIMLRTNGRLEEATAQALKAQELDPLSMIIGVNVVAVLELSGRLDEALAVGEKYMEIDSEFPQLLGSMSLLYSEKGRHRDAISAARKAAALSGDTAEQLANLGFIHARAGERQEAERLARAIEARIADGKGDPYYAAFIHAALGDHDLAFASIERAIDQKSAAVSALGIDRRLKALRSDPRFPLLVRKMRLHI